MLNIGFSELLLIVVAALLLIRPKDYPVVIKHVAKVLRQLRALADEVRGQFDGVMNESGLKDIPRTSTIIDLEGKPQTAYDVNEILPRKDAP